MSDLIGFKQSILISDLKQELKEQKIYKGAKHLKD